MYLKEGNIGKAESEEVVPVKTETKIVSQAGSAGRSPGSSFAALASWGVGCRLRSAYGGPSPGESFISTGSFKPSSNPRRRERKLHLQMRKRWAQCPSHRDGK